MDDCLIDFEDEEFWKNSIRKSAAKRLIKRNHTHSKLIQDVCNLKKEDVERLLALKDSYIMQHDNHKREEYLDYLRSHKYEDFECKRILDLNEIDIYEICEGKGQSYMLDYENIVEDALFRRGRTIAKNLALIKMTELSYSIKDIEKILEDSTISHVSSIHPVFIEDNIIYKIENHFKNMGITSMRNEILIKLLSIENNLGNVSLITGLKRSEIENFISNNHVFKSDDDETILDANKVKRETDLWECEILIECLAINGIYDDQIDDYSQLSGIDRDYFQKIYDLHRQFKPVLENILKDISEKLMDRKFDYDEIEEISGISIFGSVNSTYLYNKFKKELFNEMRFLNE